MCVIALCMAMVTVEILIVFRSDHVSREVTICLVGKYTRLEDSYASVIKALSHAALACRHRLDLKVCS